MLVRVLVSFCNYNKCYGAMSFQLVSHRIRLPFIYKSCQLVKRELHTMPEIQKQCENRNVTQFEIE